MLKIFINDDRSAHGWIAPAAVFLSACLVYLINLGHKPAFDELYHILTARSWLETGEPRLADGHYERGLIYTWQVVQSFTLLGESVAAARLPALIAMAGSATLLFVWLRHVADVRAAWLGTSLFVVSPFAVHVAQFARFYALQTFSFTAGAMAVYAAVQPEAIPRQLAWAVLAAIALALAYSLQPTTLIGLGGLGLWFILTVGVPWLLRPDVTAWAKVVVLSIFLGLSVLALLTLVLTNRGLEIWHMYRSTPLFNEANRNNIFFYHTRYLLYYPTFWSLIGLLAAVALAARPRPGLLCLAIFAPAFVLHSFAGSKGLPYLVYAQPFLFALIGIALADLWPQLIDFIHNLWLRLAGAIPLPKPLAGGLALGLLISGGLFLLLANTALVHTVASLAGLHGTPEQPSAAWLAARATLRPWLDKAEVVVTTSELEALYYLGRYDVLLNRSRLSENDGGEFTIDYRTKRPIITETASLALLLECHASGLFVSPQERWKKDTVMPEDAAVLLEKRAERVTMPTSVGIIAYAWEHPSGDVLRAHCSGEGRPQPPG